MERQLRRNENSGVGNGNRTRNRRSHSPVLYRLSYSHRHADYSNWGQKQGIQAQAANR
jgi:hypothetical protein